MKSSDIGQSRRENGALKSVITGKVTLPIAQTASLFSWDSGDTLKLPEVVGSSCSPGHQPWLNPEPEPVLTHDVENGDP